jgi:Leucine-rich repeat (LRR) protein
MELAARKADAKKNKNTLFLAQTSNKGKLDSNTLMDSLNTLGLSNNQLSYIE